MPKKTTTTTTTAPSTVDIFNVEVSPSLISQAIYVYQANSHRGINKVKTRGEVTSSKKKIYKQKGTGNARHGAKSAPIFVGGGVVFGPQGTATPLKSFNQKMKLKSLAGILNLYQKQDRLVIADLSSLKSLSTKDAIKLLPADFAKTSVALVQFNEEKDVMKSLGNIDGLDLLAANRLNVLKVAEHAKLILTTNAIELLKKRLESVSIKKTK